MATRKTCCRVRGALQTKRAQVPTAAKFHSDIAYVYASTGRRSVAIVWTEMSPQSTAKIEKPDSAM